MVRSAAQVRSTPPGTSPPTPAPLAVLGERRPGPRLALAALLVIAAAIGAVVVYQRATAHDNVLVIARPVPYGQVIANEDLKVARVSGTGVSKIEASRRSEVVGRRARATLGEGTVLANSMLIHGPAVGAGESVAPASLRPGTFPAGLQPGDRVRVVRLPASGSSQPAEPRALTTATVLSVASPKERVGTANTAVSLIVPSETADAVAAAGAAGQISLVLVMTP
jgi:Flp pilus assembly protein CpaB